MKAVQVLVCVGAILITTTVVNRAVRTVKTALYKRNLRKYWKLREIVELEREA